MDLKYIKARDIERWADSMNSQNELPLLVRWLVHGSIEEELRGICEFRAFDSVQAPGPDGRLESKIKTSHIPKGYSIWEISNQGGDLTRKNGKADKDFNERTNNHIDYQPNRSSYIFVTGHSCSSKYKWLSATRKKQRLRKNKKKVWKCIKFYDSNDLEHWLENVPVCAWRIATEIIGIYPSGVDTLENFGRMWCFNRQCKFTHKILLAGRDHLHSTLKQWLDGEPKKIKIVASNINEVIAFVWAVIKEMIDDKQELFFSRTLIVSNESDFHTLIRSKHHQVFIYKDEKAISINYATERHHVIIPMVDEIKIDKENDNYICLKPLPEDIFIKAIKVEINNNESRPNIIDYENLFHRCHGDLGILKEILN